MQIRDLGEHDLDDLLALYHHLHAADDPLPARDVVDGALVASCTLTVIPNLTRGCRPYGVIENVVTHAAHRKRGHGKALLVHALARAWSHGCYKVMLLTGRKDDATLRFYERAGFDRHGKQAFIAKPG